MQRWFGIILIAWLGTATLIVSAGPEWSRQLWLTATLSAAGITVLCRLLRGDESEASPLVALLLFPVMLAVGQIATTLTVSESQTREEAIRWCAAAATAYLAANLDPSPQFRQRLLVGCAAFATVLAVLSLAQPEWMKLAGPIWPFPITDDSAGPFANRNTYSSLIELSLPVTVWLALSRREGWAWWMAAVVLQSASVFATGSRAGSFLVAMELAVLAILATRSYRARKWTWVGMAAGVLLSLSLAGGDKLWTRLQYGDPMAYRREIYASGLAMLAERPWTGFGLGTFADAYPRFATFDVGRWVNHMHNDWLEFAVEGGVPMIAWSAGVWWFTLIAARRQWWSLGVLFVFAHSIVDYPLQRSGIWAWLWAIAACAYGGNPLRIHRRFRRRAAPALPAAPEQSGAMDRFSATTAR